jgi:hypothetical protein
MAATVPALYSYWICHGGFGIARIRHVTVNSDFCSYDFRNLCSGDNWISHHPIRCRYALVEIVETPSEARPQSGVTFVGGANGDDAGRMGF